MKPRAATLIAVLALSGAGCDEVKKLIDEAQAPAPVVGSFVNREALTPLVWEGPVVYAPVTIATLDAPAWTRAPLGALHPADPYADLAQDLAEAQAAIGQPPWRRADYIGWMSHNDRGFLLSPWETPSACAFAAEQALKATPDLAHRWRGLLALCPPSVSAPVFARGPMPAQVVVEGLLHGAWERGDLDYADRVGDLDLDPLDEFDRELLTSLARVPHPAVAELFVALANDDLVEVRTFANPLLIKQPGAEARAQVDSWCQGEGAGDGRCDPSYRGWFGHLTDPLVDLDAAVEADPGAVPLILGRFPDHRGALADSLERCSRSLIGILDVETNPVVLSGCLAGLAEVDRPRAARLIAELHPDVEGPSREAAIVASLESFTTQAALDQALREQGLGVDAPPGWVSADPVGRLGQDWRSFRIVSDLKVLETFLPLVARDEALARGVWAPLDAEGLFVTRDLLDFWLGGRRYRLLVNYGDPDRVAGFVNAVLRDQGVPRRVVRIPDVLNGDLLRVMTLDQIAALEGVPWLPLAREGTLLTVGIGPHER